MIFVLLGLGLALLLFGGMLAFLELGRRLGTRAMAQSPGAGPAGTGPLEAAVFGMLGLLIAFSFGGAVSRFEARRDLIVQEANALGTLWLRLDLLPTKEQGPVRDLVRRYLDARPRGLCADARHRGREGGARARERGPVGALEHDRRDAEGHGRRGADALDPDPPQRGHRPRDEEDRGGAASPAPADVRHALRDGLRGRAHGGLRHGARQRPRLVPPPGLRGRDRRGRVLDDGLRVPTARPDPGRCRRHRCSWTCARA